MFRDLIDRPIDPIPMEYINGLARLSSEPDYSLTCLGIALLKDRFENYKGIGGCYKVTSYESDCVRDFIERGKDDEDVPRLCYYIYSQVDNEAEDKLKAEGYIMKQNITAFLKDKAGIKCLAASHNDKNIAGIFINSRDVKFYHLIISFISLHLPHLFDEKPMQPEDFELVKSCSKDNKNTFIQKIQERVQKYTTDFRRLMLNNLLKALHDKKINDALNEVNRQRSYIEQIHRTWSEAIRSLNQMTITYEGLKATEQYDKAEEDLVDYMSTAKEIHNVSMEGSTMSFTVATKLINYNPDAWDIFRRAGHIFDGQYYARGETIHLLDAFSKIENRKILLNNIFCESPEFAVKTAGNYKLFFDECDIRTERNFDYESADPIFKSYIPNPHLKLFSCLGGYEGRVADQLHKRNYIGAIAMCIASAGSVNLDETEQTFRPFIGWIMSSREKILVRNDGVEMTPEEALIYLIDKEKTE